jgi:predicted nuclease of restriction endonuclease-like RecB superfamily
MKATLSFDLSDPDERTRHIQCIKAHDMAISLHTIREAMYKADDEHQRITFERISEALEHLNLEELCP